MIVLPVSILMLTVRVKAKSDGQVYLGPQGLAGSHELTVLNTEYSNDCTPLCKLSRNVVIRG